jgi:hypothetical protein
MNGTLVIIKVEKTLTMVQNVVVPYIEAKRSDNENLYAFEIINAE